MIINGVEYIERPQIQSKSLKVIAPYLMLAAMLGSRSVVKTNNNNYDLPHEFELVQNKQSKLSRSEREYVIREFNRKYKVK